MAFMISKAETSLSDSKKNSSSRSEEKETITRELLLRSSSPDSFPNETWDKEVVLRRIRHHKNLNKIKSALQALVNSSGGQVQEHKWLDQNDAFSSP
ncbi:Histone-lysine N-methyltransferase [Melia azedarach]|uniref:Histone-lysine N-methyltransferase n=1 Tax=Melia azedarach TaxID=155640 RepID=A0ACC1XWA6_MELAZ|nr:Histone-lysine N-methyltransferase [Melia azedarach]